MKIFAAACLGALIAGVFFYLIGKESDDSCESDDDFFEEPCKPGDACDYCRNFDCYAHPMQSEGDASET